MNTLITKATTTISAAPAGGGGATDIFDFIDNLTSSATTTIGGLLVLAGIVTAMIIAIARKTVGGVLIGAVVGGLIAGLGAIVLAASGFFTNTFTNESAADAPAIVQETGTTGDLL